MADAASCPTSPSGRPWTNTSPTTGVCGRGRESCRSSFRRRWPSEIKYRPSAEAPGLSISDLIEAIPMSEATWTARSLTGSFDAAAGCGRDELHHARSDEQAYRTAAPVRLIRPAGEADARFPARPLRERATAIGALHTPRLRDGELTSEPGGRSSRRHAERSEPPPTRPRTASG